MYAALSNLKHVDEVVIEKPVNYKAVDIILRNSKSGLISVSNGDRFILKKLGSFEFDVYLKRVWR